MPLVLRYSLIKRILGFFNLALVRQDKFTKSILPVDLELDLIFDVGANTGQYGQKIRKAGYSGTIVSFEPISSAHLKLLEASQKDPKWLVHKRSAIGNINGSAEIRVSSNSVSSSLLAMADAHLNAAPESLYETSEAVEMETLNKIGATYFQGHQIIGLKIDVQGYEMEVLRGARDVLSKFDFIQLEMSLTELYKGQVMYFEIDEYLRNFGFALWGMIPGFRDSRNGRLLQYDGLYVSKRALDILEEDKSPGKRK